ncbi:MAG: peptidyl-tRNA hydrolase [Candidatus Bathyarchaeota archaeon]|nr:MAG: peptidyl-tRNA hydrolase [Candidatus Bathyarchaeota archaeon]
MFRNHESVGKNQGFKYKQVIVLRVDLGMSEGKIAAQAGHAAVSAAEKARKKNPHWWSPWMKEGQCKIAVKARSKHELLELEKKAKKLKLPSALITDRGLTELLPGTVTCLGIGPAPSSQVDKITGSLNLF